MAIVCLFVCLLIHLPKTLPEEESKAVVIRGRTCLLSLCSTQSREAPSQPRAQASSIYICVVMDWNKWTDLFMRTEPCVFFHFPCVKEKTEDSEKKQRESKQLRVWTRRILEVCMNASVTYLHAGLLKLFWSASISALGEKSQVWNQFDSKHQRLNMRSYENNQSHQLL